ncbi:MAG TPA: DDE-type integrase/transposase/recombinase [Dehalococcoidia bacterium]|nr:DDE-type integrase/transposase/recombinase [Dehalococcoidia bacterium]
MTEIKCKYCDSKNVIKYGKYKDVQYYYCKDCKRKFAGTGRIPKMQYSTDKVADALNMYYEGMSLKEIRRNFIQQHNDYISDVSPLNWANRFSKLAIIEANKYRPNVGSVWVADETVIDIDGKNIWFWDIIDTKTRFLIASHMSYTRTAKDAQQLMRQAYERTGKIPRLIYTDKLRAYLDGIELTFGADTNHRQGGPFDIECNTNLIERFHGTIKSRTKVMRGLHTIESARLFMDGWLVHYNFFRPHMSLRDMTPAQAAGIKFPFRNWKDVIEQPYERTSRIPVIRKAGRIAKPKRARITKRRPRISPQPTAISQIRGMK